MKSVKFLQQARQFADYVIQSVPELDAASQRSNPDFRTQRDATLVDLPPWDGSERRVDADRRENERRNERQSAMLDTRAGSDRRRECRRETDELQLRGFSCRV
jgi:hypothetical protein